MSSTEENEPTYCHSEVTTHNTPASAWISLNGIVYDITDFIEDERNHPGGMTLVKEWLGKDISEVFGDSGIHVHTQEATDILEFYRIGRVAV